MNVKHQLKLIFVVTCACLLVLIGATNAAAQGNEPADHALKNPVKKTVQGVAINDSQKDGCRYAISGSLAADDKPVSQNIIYQDPATCTAVIEEGEPIVPLGGPPKKDPRGISETKTKKAGDLFTESTVTDMSVAGSSSIYNSRAYVYAWTEDPVEIDVNKAASFLDWWYDYSYIYLSPSECSYYWWWLTESGWSRQSTSTGCQYYYYGIGNMYLDSSNWTHYHHWAADVYYDEHATGDTSGSFYPYIVVDIYGSGGGLLHYHTEWGYY